MTLKTTNISTGDYKTTQQNTFRWAILVALLLYFSFLALVQETNVLNDSQQYFMMHIHREPLYCLFLWLFRIAFGGKELYLEFVAIVQGILAAVSIWHLAEVVRKQFALKTWEEFIISLIGIFPFLLTRFFSVTHIDISNSIMSEALCLPLFYLFLSYIWKMAWEQKRKDYVVALLFALLASLTRGQMMLTILVWLVVAIYLQFFGRRDGGFLTNSKGMTKRGSIGVVLRNVILLIACALVIFFIRSFLVKSYNLIYNGHYIENTYGQVNLLTNVLYASDVEDVQYIVKEENRVFYLQMMDKAYENEATHRFSGNSLSERAQGIEDNHDFLKFECIEKILYEYYDNNVTTDYIEQNLMEDQVASELMRDLLPHVWKEWLINYVSVVYRGLVRSIAVIHPLLNVAVIFGILLSVGVTILGAIKNPMDQVALALGISLLLLLANAFACAITIMCLSRYMIYSFAGFYISIYLLIRATYRKVVRQGRTKDGKQEL